MGYFDGSAAGDRKICGACGKLYIFDNHYFSFKVGLGVGTNNFAELCALKLLLSLAQVKHINKIQIFGDSQLVINWAKGKYIIQNIILSHVLLEVNQLSNMFELVELKHIFCERNTSANDLAKSGAVVMEGYWYIKEFIDSGSFETYQIF